MVKPKTIPAIEPNAGLKASLQKRLSKLISEQTRAATVEVLQALISSGQLVDGRNMAQDAELSQRALEQLYRANNPGMAVDQLNLEIAKRLARWMIETGEKAKAVSQWFVRAAALNVTSSQRGALIRAGISPAFLREKWKVPLISRRYISPTAAQKIPAFVDEMTGLITKMQAEDLARVRETIAEGLLNGFSIKDLQTTLEASKGFTEARAKRVALDQSIKVNQGVQRANAQDIGVKTAIWVHVPGQYTSRESHIKMNGKRFNIGEGLFDSAVGEKVLPGTLPFCRCQMRLDIDELLKDER